MSFRTQNDARVRCLLTSFQTYFDGQLANTVYCHCRQVMARSATVVKSHFEIINAPSATVAHSHFGLSMALGEDMIWSFRNNHSILYSMEIYNSCRLVSRSLFRQLFPYFQFYKRIWNNVSQFYSFLLIFNILCSTFLSSDNAGYFVMFCVLWTRVSVVLCRTASFLLVSRQLRVLKWYGFFSDDSTVSFAGL